VSAQPSATLKRYRCISCNHIYDPAVGDPDSNIPPGTAFEDLPEDWSCPDCGAPKADFEPMG
jgi:rubredoxin